jgi:hypothetical protein
MGWFVRTIILHPCDPTVDDVVALHPHGRTTTDARYEDWVSLRSGAGQAP